MGKELSEMTLEELWELFPIILKEYNEDYKNWYDIEKLSLINCIGQKNIKISQSSNYDLLNLNI